MDIQQKILEQATSFAKAELKDDPSGHDWWHIYRVARTAKTIAREENADSFICQLAALLHDIADEKISGDQEAGLQKVNAWLIERRLEESIVAHVMEIISTMSFKGGNMPPMNTLEGKVVQDADRLDAIGAVGIARTFAFCGAKEQLIHDPTIVVRENMTVDEYRQGNGTGINHFYEKLLKLKDLLNTSHAKKLADQRHRFMELYLDQFYKEWEGNA